MKVVLVTFLNSTIEIDIECVDLDGILPDVVAIISFGGAGVRTFVRDGYSKQTRHAFISTRPIAIYTECTRAIVGSIDAVTNIPR